MCVVSDSEAFSWNDDETAGEDGEGAHHLSWAQQRDSPGQRHSDGLRHPAQHHPLSPLRPQHGQSVTMSVTQSGGGRMP